MNWASRVFGCTVVLCALLACQDARASQRVTFSQERVAYDTMGNRLPAEVIDPSRIVGMSEHRFALHGENVLVIRTNIADPLDRGLSRLAEVVKGCYLFVQEQSGRQLGKGILIYLLEFENPPEYYRFEVTCSDKDVNWCEVRLALVSRGDPLHGPGASQALKDLLFDTLPHELGHDVLAKVAPFQDDDTSRSPLQTRWFAEGVCEMLAKGFARREAPDLWPQFLALRNVGSVLHDPRARSVIYLWALENVESMRLESDLYGASMLLLMAWTEKISLKELLDKLDQYTVPVTGVELAALMQQTTGLDHEQMLDVACRLGESLASKVARRAIPDL